MKQLKKYTIVGMGLLALASCTDKFEEINTNPNQPDKATPDQLLTTAQYNFSNNIWDDWNNGRMGLYYAQYWSSTYYSNESRYAIREGVNQTMWNTFYVDVINELAKLQEADNAEQLIGYENRVAIAELIKAFTFHYLSDIYGGPIPYSEAINEEIATPVYDSGEAIYAGILASIEAQLAILDETGTSFEVGDIVYGGDVAKWKKFANSFRLRIALRMIDAKPAEALEAIKKSLDPANGGVISSNEESARFSYLSGAPNNNPLNEAFKTRIDFSVCKTLVDYLTTYDDPRLPVYAEPVQGTADVYEGELYGIEEGGGNSNGANISLPAEYAIGATAPSTWLDYAEVEFMLAEIAARGLDVGLTGTAEEHYLKGISASLEFAGLDEAAYNAYILNVPYLPAKWKDCIGSQKWLAMYMQGIQGWLERLRLEFKDPYTGEEIFVAPADGSLDADVELVPARMSYPVTEASLNGENYSKAIEMIGGQNSKGISSWWDQ